MPRTFYKQKLLFDEGFPPRSYFPQVNVRFDVKHIRDDFKKIGLPDTAVYALAVQLQRLVVTYNVKDFKPLAQQRKETGVIGVSPLMPYHHIDTKLTALLVRSSAKALVGKLTTITGETLASYAA